MQSTELRFALWISSSHGIQHFLRRIFPPLIPIWVVVFEFPLALAGLLLGVQSLGSALGQTPFGILSDRHDRRYILPSGIALAAICVGVFAIVPFLDVVDTAVTIAGYTVDLPFVLMVVAMFGVGFGGSVLHPTGYPLISENVSRDRKGRVLGMWGSAAKLGDGFAPAVVGALLLLIAWTEILVLLSVLICVYSIALFVVLNRFETRPPSVRETDSTPEGSESEEHDTATDQPTSEDSASTVWTIDRRVFLYPMLAIFAFFAIRMLAAGGVNVFIPEFITSEYGYSFTLLGIEVTPESTASFYYSALLITAGVVQLGTGRLVDTYDARKVLISMLVVAAAVLSVLTFASLSPLLLFVVLLLLGASLWALEPARDTLVSDITPADREGRTFGYLWTGALTVAAISPVLIGYIGDHVGLRAAFGVLAVATLVSAIPIALLFHDRIYVDADDVRSSTATADDD